MGYLTALDAAALADAGTLISYDMALELHLTSNHYPPVPRDFVPACKQAIQTFIIAARSSEEHGEETVYEQLTESMVELPNGKMMSVIDIVEALHLEAFIDYEIEKYGI